MTQEELKRIEDQVRDHKAKGQSSNITLKVIQVERLISAAYEALPKADVVDFDLKAETNKGVNEGRFRQKWSNANRQYKIEKEYIERKDLRQQRREEMLLKWKTFAGYQKQSQKN